MSQVLEKVWSDFSRVLEIHITYAISICKTLLDPLIDDIQITLLIESKIKRNIISFIIF